MSNQITSTGIVVNTQAELLAYFTAGYQTAYGADIDLDPDSPDGQAINLTIQAILDVQDLIVQVFNMFDPDQAIGAILDQRIAINGVIRQAGTYTVTPVTIVLSQSVNLYGLDQTAQPVYTVTDSLGNEWELQVTQLGVSGTQVLNFQASAPGATVTIPNTITVPVTIILGVTSINNPTTYTTLGIVEESDNNVKIRRQQSTAIASQGFYAGLKAALQNINGVSSATVIENDTASPVVYGADTVPSHSIWVIVGGSGAAASIAQTIYAKRNGGCGMYGAINYTVTQVDGTPFVVTWDDVIEEMLYVFVSLESINGITIPNTVAVVAQLPTLFTPGVNQIVNITMLSTIVQSIDPNSFVASAGFGTDAADAESAVYPILSPTSPKYQFEISNATMIIYPIFITPQGPTVAHGDTQQFTANGGYASYTWSLATNASGGSINSSTGLYTAGSTHPATDVVLVTDSFSQLAETPVFVT